MAEAVQDPVFEASVVIVGAGYAGVSALHASLHYLEPGERVVVADLRRDWGGNWRDQYDFVRLHQPHPMFTAYDQEWALEAERSHLASRSEVIAHLSDLGERARACAKVETLFGYRYVSHADADGGLDVVFESADCQRRVVRAKRLIKATGFDIRKKEALVLAARGVESIPPAGLSASVREGRAHYCVVGSGKTAMDAIAFLAREAPGQRVTLVSGGGIAFLPREDVAPSDARTRYFGGRTVVDVCMDHALQWDGTNHLELLREGVRRGTFVSPVPEPYACLFGLLGQGELDTVQTTISRLIKGRMADVEEQNGGAALRMQDGRRIPLERARGERLVVVGCTENLHVPTPEPILQNGGRVLAPQTVLFFSGPTATALTHAWYRGGLRNIVQDLRVTTPRSMDPQDKPLAFFAGSLAFLSNLQHVIDVLPASFFQRDKSNFQTWFPPHRQLLTAGRLRRHRRTIEARCRALLGDANLYPRSADGARSSAHGAEVRFRTIEANGLRFRARTTHLGDRTERDGVILLHGFPQTSISWESLMAVTARNGIPCIAFDQRGYSPGARLAPMDAYSLSNLVSDVFAVADAAGFERFHLVGQDWGGIVAWQAAVERPSRLLSLVSLGSPHPATLRMALSSDGARPWSDVLLRLTRRGRVVERIVDALGRAAMRGAYDGLPRHHVEEYVRVLSEPGALSAALNWYRAFPFRDAMRSASVRVPVLYFSGQQDFAVLRGAADLQRVYVEANYQRVDLDVGHWLLASEPETVVREVLAHWERFGSKCVPR
ncbi:MAG: alpha/beta fold hydrolase [Myxococcota bacterium]